MQVYTMSFVHTQPRYQCEAKENSSLPSLLICWLNMKRPGENKKREAKKRPDTPQPSSNPFAAAFQSFESNSGSSSSSPPQLEMDAVAEYLVDDASMATDSGSVPKSSFVFQCGPHHDCCGGFYNPSWKQFTRCQKRIAQHIRGQVCLTSHSYITCSTCPKVVHLGCWVQRADGTYMLPDSSVPFQCFECDYQKNVNNCAARLCTLT